jgi:hypothetical protein
MWCAGVDKGEVAQGDKAHVLVWSLPTLASLSPCLKGTLVECSYHMEVRGGCTELRPPNLALVHQVELMVGAVAALHQGAHCKNLDPDPGHAWLCR